MTQSSPQSFPPLTFEQWHERARSLDARAERVSLSIRNRARDLGEQIGLGRDSAFHLAHNALCSDKGFDGVDRRACRRILWLGEQSYEPGRIVSRINQRSIDRIVWPSTKGGR